MPEILTLGELLIDLTQNGSDDLGNGQFIAYPGGAPANVAVAASRLGADTGFIGKVGNDAFGRSLAAVLRKDGVDVSGLYVCDDVPTTMAIVSVDENGEREFAFYRNPGADTQLTAEEALLAVSGQIHSGAARFSEDAGDSRRADLPMILHVGSLSLTTEPGKTACCEAVRFARENGVLISYDPNYRAALWDSEERAVEMMKSLIPYADVLKVSDEEMLMLTGSDDCAEGSRILSGYGPKLVMVTLGSEGVFVRCGDLAERIPGFSVKVADTNGAGDTFLGAMLAQIARRGREACDEDAGSGESCNTGEGAGSDSSSAGEGPCSAGISSAGEGTGSDGSSAAGEEPCSVSSSAAGCGRTLLEGLGADELRRYVTYANKAASITCSRRGAIPAMPRIDAEGRLW